MNDVICLEQNLISIVYVVSHEILVSPENITAQKNMFFDCVFKGWFNMSVWIYETRKSTYFKI